MLLISWIACIFLFWSGGQ